MLQSQFAKSLFQDLIKRKTERLNMKLYLANPTFSSIGGFSKYGLLNKIYPIQGGSISINTIV